jgi:TatD DNase family protein
MTMLVDSHCHLDFPDFEEDRDALVARARAAGVGLMVTISTKFSQADKIIALSEQYEDVLCSVGTHPHEAGAETTVSGDVIAAKATHAKVIGVGETGLDYFYEHSEKEKQKQSFIAHIEASRLTQLPLIVHARDADTDTAQILENEMAIGTYPGLIHCFTAGPELARRALDMGFYISISGIATFKNAQNLRDVIKTIPLDRLLVETDAPYLAPMPHRGKRNEPSFVPHTAARLAELFDISAEDFATQTTQNFFRLFTKANKPV